MFYTSFTGSMHIAVADLIFPALAILTVAMPATARQSLASRPIVVYAIVLLTVAAVSAMTASLLDPRFITKLAAQNVLKLLVVLAYAVVFAIHASRLDRHQFCGLLRLWGWTATVVALATIATAAGAHIVPLAADGSRSLGYFQDANLYGGYLLISLSAVIAAETLSHSSWTLLQVLSITSAILLTASRGAMVSLALILVIAFVFIATWKWRLIVVGLGSVAGFLIYVAGPGLVATWLGPALDRLTTSGRAVGDDPRLRLWGRALAVWNDHPVFGVGIGQFGRFTIDVNGLDEDEVGQIAHNTFLSFLVETGICGLLVCVAGMAILALRLYRDRRLDLRLRHALGLGILAISAEMFTLNLHNVRYVWVFAGLVWGFTQWKQQLPEEDSSIPARELKTSAP